jgi:BirA family biotin operon repressor/biotin-[acetyl-CoA-carboxylase] ligase
MDDWLDLIELYDEVDSTMSVARQRAHAGAPTGTTIIAATQSAGRGRRGRSWFSPKGAGLWMTTILRPPASGAPLHTLGLVAGCAVQQAAGAMGATAARLKWPNDVVIEDRKLAGILTEAERVDASDPIILVGVGLNLMGGHELALPEDIAHRYIGMANLVPRTPSPEEAGKILLGHLTACYNKWVLYGLTPILESWRQTDALYGHVVRAEGPQGEVVGVADGLGSTGELRVQTEQGLQLIQAGEVLRVRNKESDHG